VRDDDGAALAFVILLMLALLVLAHGALLASLSEVAGSRAAARDLELRGASRWALAVTLRSPSGTWSDSMYAWGIRNADLGSVGQVSASGELMRLGRESWLVTGEARNSRGATARTSRLAWALDPLERIAALDGLVSSAPGAPVVLLGSADATRPAEVDAPMPAGGCDPWLAALQDRYAAVPLSLVEDLPDSAAAPALGLLTLDSLLEWAPVTVSGTGTPAAAEAAGACLVDAPWGWGDPDRPWGPCGGQMPMRASDGDLTVIGGAGQGILVVGGDLTLRDGARYYGMLVVGGMLRAEGGAAFEGLALAGGGVLLHAGSTLTASACWAVRALADQREALGSLVEVSVAGPMGPW
jgi:hypothetical protein